MLKAAVQLYTDLHLRAVDRTQGAGNDFVRNYTYLYDTSTVRRTSGYDAGLDRTRN